MADSKPHTSEEVVGAGVEADTGSNVHFEIRRDEIDQPSHCVMPQVWRALCSAPRAGETSLPIPWWTFHWPADRGWKGSHRRSTAAALGHLPDLAVRAELKSGDHCKTP